MIRPAELASDAAHGPTRSSGRAIWAAFRAAADGDVAGLRALLAQDPELVRAEYFGTQPIHFAVREGRVEALRVLLQAGADPHHVGVSGDDLASFARDRGHDEVLRVLLQARNDRGRVDPVSADEHAIHAAVARGDHKALRALVADDPACVHAQNRAGFLPLDTALWRDAFWNLRRDFVTARLLIRHGASCDLVIACALGEVESVRRRLDQEPERLNAARPSGKRALSAAIEFGHGELARLLLERGADPNGSEGSRAPRGTALHSASRNGDLGLVTLLLDRGADPNCAIDSSGSAAYVAGSAEVRALLLARGAVLDAYDLVWLGESDEVVRRVSADPRAADAGCGGVLAAACTLGKKELLVRLLDAGARVPATLTACRSHLLCEPELLRHLLESGMDPDLPNWMHATPLHDLCGRDGRGRARAGRRESATILLDAGASLHARDEDYRSTPLAWAARSGLADMLELLLERGAPPRLDDDELWARPLAWAERRGHGEIARTLRLAGA